YSREWLAALDTARGLPDSELPPLSQPFDGPPPVNRWERRDPVAAARLARARAALNDLSVAHTVPVENLLAPDAVRRLCWDGLGDYARPRPLADLVAQLDTVLTTPAARPSPRPLPLPPLAQARLPDEA